MKESAHKTGTARIPKEVQRVRVILLAMLVQSITDLTEQGTGRDLARAKIDREIARKQVYGDGNLLERICHTLGHSTKRWRALAAAYESGEINAQGFKWVVASALDQLYEP